ncbi:MAG: class I SAM-dependent methyltransferase [Solimonas sp.]
MSQDTKEPPPRPDYGIDAPDAVSRFLMIGTVAIVVQFGAPLIAGLLPVNSAQVLLGTARSLGWMGYGFVATACVMLWGSRIGKLRLRDKVLDAMPWRGDERVLDVGCGRGLLLAGVAARVPRGHVSGIDVWRSEDQTRNGAAATLRNLRIEGIEDRADVRTADARHLPFEASSFDAVVSSWALHNIADAEGRTRALREIDRVLKPGGRVALIDIRHGRAYAAWLRDQGYRQVRVGPPSFLFVVPTLTVTAQKPA